MLVRRADAQAILDVREVAVAREEAEEVLALRLLYAPHGRLVGEEPAGLPVVQEQLVEALDDVVCVLLGEGAEGGQLREIGVGELEEGAA